MNLDGKETPARSLIVPTNAVGMGSVLWHPRIHHLSARAKTGLSVLIARKQRSRPDHVLITAMPTAYVLMGSVRAMRGILAPRVTQRFVPIIASVVQIATCVFV